jgi:dihydroneopterin aldolase
MAGQIIIERLEFQGRCGITAEERATPQPLAVDLTLDYPSGAWAAAVAADAIAQAVDYAAVSAKIVEAGGSEAFALLESMAERMSGLLFAEFPITGLDLWLRKTRPPVPDVHGSVGVRLQRHRLPADAVDQPQPAGFLVEQERHLPKGRVLDLAAGRGRNALYLATHGYAVEAVDRDEQALAALAAAAAQRHLPNLTTRCLDLEASAGPDLGKERYDGIVVFFYLHRPLFPLLKQALKPGGALIYETFLIDNHLRWQHPRRREFCLEHNELLELAGGLRVLHYEEGGRDQGHGPEPAFTARLVARRERAS